MTAPPDRPLLDDLADERADESPRRDRRLLRWVLLLVVLAVAGLYLAGYAFAGDRLPQSTTVAGVDVGGMRPARAERVLARELAEPMKQPVTLQVDGESYPLDPSEVGMDVDLPASVAQVPVGRSWNPADMWETFVGGEDYDPVVVTVDGLLTERLTALAEETGTAPVEGAVTFTRKGAEPTYPKSGSSLDVGALTDAVTAAYPQQDRVEVELVPVEPTISRDEVSRAMDEFANPAMSAPVTFVVGGERVVLRPAQFAPALSMAPDGGTLVPQVDGTKLMAAFRPAMRTLADQPQDATVRIVQGRPQVIPGKKGISIDQARVEESFLDLVVAEGDGRRLTLPTRVTAPEFTTADARALGIRQVVSEFTTYYPHADYRNTNIGRAAALVDGTILKPGETFSLNRTVGERTPENGFAKGFIISNGIFKEDYGGGVSQVATTTFNAAFFAGLEDVEHKPHSFYIDRYPVGREATVAWPTVDLRFRNDTDHGVLIQTVHRPSSWSSSGAITVRMWSTKVWDIEAQTSGRYAYTPAQTRTLTGDDCIPNQGYSGFQVDVTRVFRRAGETQVARTEKMHTVYTPSDTVVCR